MRLLFLFLILLAGCSVTQTGQKQEKPITESEEYMTNQEIIQQMNIPYSAQEEQAPSEKDNSYRKRLDSLTPTKTFLKGLEKLKEPKDMTQKEEKDLPLSVELREFCSPVKDQNDGYCSAYAAMASLEGTMCKEKGLCKEDMSEQYLFSQYDEYSAELGVKAVTDNKQVDEKYWPQYGKRTANISKYGHSHITQNVYLGQKPSKAIEALARGHFVVVGMATPNDMLSCRQTIRPTTTAANGGHALLITGYRKTPDVTGGSYMTIKNSWGTDCGDKGYQYVPFEAICKKSGFYCYFWEIIGATTDKTPTIPPVDPTPPTEPTTPIPPEEPKGEADIRLYCYKRTIKNFWKPKSEICWHKCVKNCSEVCPDKAETCELPYEYEH